MKRAMKLTDEEKMTVGSLTDKIPVKVVSREGNVSFDEYSVLKEHMLIVKVNGLVTFRILCTDTFIKELVYGRIYTEGLSEGNVRSLQLDLEERSDGRTVADVTGDVFQTGDVIFEEVLKKRVSERDPVELPDPEDVFLLADEFGRGTILNSVTKGTHSAFLMHNKKTVFSCEDIGRHNCVDKAVGYALLNNIPLDKCILYSSGRVPSDMVEKVIASGIPVLVSKAVPTDEALKLAKKYKLTIICRAWSDSYTVFDNNENDDKDNGENSLIFN